MNKDVVIKVSGLQSSEGGEETVEVTTVGSYYYKNNKHYLMYEEVLDGTSAPVTNTLKIQPGQVDVIKNGSTHVHMSFRQDRRSTSLYCTPYGAIEVGLDTKDIQLQEMEEELHVRIRYGVEMSNEYVGDCSIRIDVTPAG